MVKANIIDVPQLGNRVGVFRDRPDAGQVLAAMLNDFKNSDALVLAIPAGGVPVAAVIARQLNLALDVAVVSKITLPWNSEAGYGAIAFDGTVRLNEGLMRHIGLSEEEIQKGIARTTEKVKRRFELLRGNRPLPDISRRAIVLIDDGLASGFTMLAAIEALRKAGAEQIVIAVPTAHSEAMQKFTGLVEAIYCPNIRSGYYFAVADAYQLWSDVSDKQVQDILCEFTPI